MKKENIKELEICKNCKWRGQNDYSVEGFKLEPSLVMGQCWRYPKRYNTWDGDFCGEFKLKSQTK